MIYIIGHTKPDLDSAVTAVALKAASDKLGYFGYPDAEPVLASTANHETKTIFARFNNIPLPPVLKSEDIKPEDRFVLVDHNEASQRLKGIEDEQIIDIFDHHKVVVSFTSPICITTRPWGASATVVAWLMEMAKYQPSQNLASLMVSAILSDTVGLKSPTTTPKDKDSLTKLNQIAQIPDLEELTFAIFQAKSDISGLNVSQVLTKDYKVFNFGDKKVLINQVETVEQNKILSESEKYLDGMAEIKTKMKLDQIYCLVTDVLKVNSRCLVLPEGKVILSQAFPKAVVEKEGVYDLGPVMSRKKEVAPAIEKAILS